MMTHYRFFLFSFLSVLWVFLSGFNKPVVNLMSGLETQKTEVELKLIDTENNSHKALEAKQVKTKGVGVSDNTSPPKRKQTINKATDTGDVSENNPRERDEFEKPLDLTVPFKGSENSLLKMEKKSTAQSRVTNIFAADSKNKSRPLELDGDFVMTPYPESGKQQSVDGAGIVIKLKP